MPEYVYSAYQSPNARIDGQLVAESESAAAESLLRRGLQPVRIRAIESRPSLLRRISLRKHIGNRERALLARQLGDLLTSGMSMLDALVLLEHQTESPPLRGVLRAMQEAVRGGKSLGEAMDTLPKDFSKVHVRLVKAGEGTGLLTMVLGQIATLEEKEYDLKTKIRAALLYPTITAVVGILTVLVILNFVIPRLSSIFLEMDQALPLITRWLLAFSAAARWVWKWAIPIVLAVVILLRLLPRWRNWLLFRDRVLLRVPRLGRLILTMQITRFTGILGSLLRNGVPMVPALSVTTETLDNRAVQRDLRRAVERVNQGERLGEALKKEDALPRVVTGMISVGETTGNLEVSLSRISESGTQDADRMVKTLVGLVEPALILFMGLFVAFIVAAVIIPIFQVNLAL